MPEPYHPRGPAVDRRNFLKGSMVAALALGSPAFIAACGKRTPEGGGPSGSAPGGGVALSRPGAPATLPLFDDNPAIAAGLEPETGGTFKIFNYPEYLGPDITKAFGKKYGVKVEVTTFTTMSEAVTKLQLPASDFDVFFPTPDIVGKVVAGKLLQPVNHSYLKGLTNVWDQLQDPFYDQGSQYTVPYTVYQTGIGYRADRVTPAAGPTGGYDLLWDPANKGRAYLIDDNRESLAMVMLRDNLTDDINTEDPAIINAAQEKLSELIDLVNIKLGIQAYTAIPEGSATVYQCWSGDMINAQYYLPKGQAVETLGYWFPSEEPGVVGSDCIAIPKAATKPVLAHHFLDYMLQPENAVANFGYVGYQPPQKTLDPDSLIKDEYIAENLSSAVVRPEDYASAQQLLQISQPGEAIWNTAWAKFKSGQ